MKDKESAGDLVCYILSVVEFAVAVDLLGDVTGVNGTADVVHDLIM